MTFRRLSLWLAAVLVATFLLSGRGHAAPLPPSPSPRYVQDDAGWLGAHAYSALDLKLEWFERDTSNQVIVAIYPKLPEDEELFDYSQRIFDAWKPGQQGKDNGVLLLVFDQDRKIRIHTGYGAEGALPDARANQIIRDVMAPRIRAGDKEAAIDGGTEAIMAALKGEYQGDGTTNLDQKSNAPGEVNGFWVAAFVIGFILLGFRFPILFQVVEVIFSALGSSSGRGGGGSSWGGGGGSSSSSGGGGFSGGGGRSGGGGASGGW